MRIVVTGGAGFIGSAVVRRLLEGSAHEILNVDLLTYAGNLESLADVADSPRYRFVQLDIRDAGAVRKAFRDFAPDAVMHLAAESHVDRSIDSPGEFITTNVVGTYTLLAEAREYLRGCDPGVADRFRFHHVSTDEVFGSLADGDYFTESTPYQPNSPYSASKAAADHLVRAWHKTFDLPVVTSNCTNNYGPRQFPEKLVPLMILNAREGRPLPVYGDGLNIRDWLYVDDHASALQSVLERGRPGEVYCIGGESEKTNMEVVHTLCDLMDELCPESPHVPHRSLISFVKDRPGHDRRYAMEISKIKTELGWKPAESFESGMRKTIAWYLENRAWCDRVQDGSYRRERLGLEHGN